MLKDEVALYSQLTGRDGLKVPVGIIGAYLDGYERGKADAQPDIVRCKDCDWWTKQEDSLQGRCALLQMYPTGGWFCGSARRREVTE